MARISAAAACVYSENFCITSSVHFDKGYRRYVRADINSEVGVTMLIEPSVWSRLRSRNVLLTDQELFDEHRDQWASAALMARAERPRENPLVLTMRDMRMVT